MLQLKQGATVLQTVMEGSAFTLPNGDVVSPAYNGWVGGGYTLEAGAEPPPTAEELIAAERSVMRLSFAQLMIGLVSEGWLTPEDGRAWRDRVALPTPVQALISSLPAEQQFAAETRALAPSEIARLDPLVIMLGASQQKTPEQIDAFFRKYAAV